MDVNRASHLFCEISAEEIRALFLASLGESEIKTSRLLEGGLFNTTYYVEYGAEPRRAVLRLGPVNRHLLLGHETNLMAAEACVCRICHQAGIPCSRVLACDTSRQRIDRDYMIVEYIPSVVMSAAALTDEARERLRRRMGTYLNRLHQIEGDCFGYVSRICQGLRFDTWHEAFLYEAEDILSRLESVRVFPPEVFAALRQRFPAGRAALAQIKTPHLLHTDMWEGNVLLTEDAGEIAAIIDGDRAVYGDVDFEFASDWGRELAPLCGCGDPASGDAARRERTALYRLYYALLETFVWAVEYDGPHIYSEKRAHVLKLLQNSTF